MRKLLLSLFAVLVGGLFFVAPAFADLSVNIEQPKSPNNQNNFPLNFVALTTTGNAVTVKCFKKGPSDGAFAQFGSDIVLSSGGNSGDCDVNAGIITADGLYQFYVEASDGANTESTNTPEKLVSVTIDSSYPDTPTGYAKTRVDSCTYKIHIHTASDAGKTVKVEIYRSDSKTFTADGGTRVGTVAIGSNADADFTNSVPDCNKTYYYVIRAFSSNGNGSGVTGDSEANVITTVISPTTTQQQGAIPVNNGQGGGNGSVLGAENGAVSPTESPTGSEEKQVLGSENTNTAEAAKSFFSSKKNIAIVLVLAVVLLGVLFLLWRRMRNR